MKLITKGNSRITRYILFNEKSRKVILFFQILPNGRRLDLDIEDYNLDILHNLHS